MEFSNPNNARQINRLRVLCALQNECLTRADLSRVLLLNKVSVSEIIKGLIEEELVIETAKTTPEKDGGRPGTVLQIKANHAYVIGIDIASSSIRFALSDIEGKILRYEQVPYKGDEDLTTLIVDSLKRILKSNNKEILALSIASGRKLDDEKGTIELENGQSYPLKEKLIALGLTIPILFVSQLSAQVYAEKMNFKLPLSSFLFINWGEHLTSAFVTKLETIENLEFGHIPIAQTGLCHCGSVGCIETLASGWGFRNTSREQLNSEQNVKQLMNSSEGEAILKKGIEKLGKVLALAIQATGAEAVMLSGGISALNDQYFSYLSNCVAMSLPTRKASTPVYRASFKEKGTSQGAVLMALDHYLYSRSLLCSLGYLEY